jgi:hypothetical protein
MLSLRKCSFKDRLFEDRTVGAFHRSTVDDTASLSYPPSTNGNNTRIGDDISDRNGKKDSNANGMIQ